MFIKAYSTAHNRLERMPMKIVGSMVRLKLVESSVVSVNDVLVEPQDVSFPIFSSMLMSHGATYPNFFSDK